MWQEYLYDGPAGSRPYFVYTPANYQVGTAVPLLVIFHGCVQTVGNLAAGSQRRTIDRRRVYVAGISAGAAMAVVLGATYPDFFAAIGVHSGAEYRATSSFGGILRVGQGGGPDPLQQGQVAYDAMGSRACVVPTIVVQGTRDPIVRPINGDQVIQQWMQTNALASGRAYNASFNSPASATSGSVPGGHS